MSHPSDELEVSIVMPAYNEEANIDRTVRECMDTLQTEGIPGEVIVTNDGSRDGTLKILERLKAEFGNFRYIDLKENCGYGGALKRAIDASTGRYVVTIDSDGQFDIRDMPRLLDKLREGHDCVTGYRKRKKDTLPRVVANWGYNFLVRALCGLSFTDAQCALKAYRGDVIRSLDLEARGFTFPTETLIKLQYSGRRIAELPIRHRHRHGGESKVRFLKTVRIMFVFLLYIRFKLALHRNRIIFKL
ncbi:MAG: glycosyltransferase family 2 protein [bacterium]